MEETPPRPGEDAQLRQGLARYTDIVDSTASVLLWTLFAYLAWLPPILLSRRARATFASRPVIVSTAASPNLEAITSPPRFPG